MRKILQSEPQNRARVQHAQVQAPTRIQTDTVVTVGPDPGAYRRMEAAVRNYKPATNATAIVVNPMRNDLPRMVAYFGGTCLAETAEEATRCWRNFERLYNKHLKEVLGPLHGQSSDGDSRRRAAQQARSLSVVGTRYGLRDCPGFVHTGVVRDGVVCDLTDQCYVHCGKKLINVTASATRTLRLGPSKTVHMSIFTTMWRQYNRHEHGLRQEDLSRKGYMAMDWPSAQRLMSQKALQCLTTMSTGRHPYAAGAVRYFTLTRRYTAIFLGRQLTLRDRITSAAYVVTYLRLWRLWTKYGELKDAEGKDMSGTERKKCFITREAFEDVKASCHFAVLLIAVHADYYPSQPVRLDRTGGDPVEDLWSWLGSWVRNKRTFTLLDAKRTLRSMLTVQAAIARGSIYLRNPKRRRDTWDDTDGEPASLLSDISDTERSELWKKGTEEAYQDVTKDGMKPPMRRERSKKSTPSALPRWWTHPEEFDSDVLRHRRKGTGVAGRDDDEVDAAHDGEEEFSESDNEEVVATDSETESDGPNDDEKGDGISSSDDSARPLIFVQDAAVLARGAEMLAAMSEEAGTTGVVGITQRIQRPIDKQVIHKATALVELTEYKRISNDRTQRVRTNTQNHTSDKRTDAQSINLGVDSWEVGVHHDVSVKFGVTDKGGKLKYIAWVGRILRVRAKQKRGGWTEYTQPVQLSYERMEKKNSDIYVQCHYYRVKSGKGAQATYSFDHSDPTWVHVESIISPVTMHYCEHDESYTMPEHHYNVMMKSIQGIIEWQIPPERRNIDES